MYTGTRINTHTHTHTPYTHTNAHTCTYVHTHTHTYIHTNVRMLCRYYNKFNSRSISFAMHYGESVLLSSYGVWRNNLLIRTRLFILLEWFISQSRVVFS